MTRGYLVGGDDDFEIKNTTKKIITSLQQSIPDIELEVIDGSSNNEPPSASTFWNVVTTLQTPSLFANPKIVWFKDVLFSATEGGEVKPKGKKKGAKSENVDPVSPLIELIEEGIPEGMYLIMNASGMDRRKAFYKTCETAHFQIDWITKLDPNDRKYAQQIGLKIEHMLAEYDIHATADAVNCLKEILNGDSGRMRTEIEKLSIYAGGFGAKVTRKDCMEVCSHTPEALGWAFSDALIARDLSRALTAIDELISQMEAERSGGYELILLASASNAFQNLLKTYEAIDALNINVKRVNPKTFDMLSEDVKSENKGNFLLSMHPFRAFKMVEQLSAFPPEQLVKTFTHLLDANKELVSSGADNARMSLERLAMKICY